MISLSKTCDKGFTFNNFMHNKLDYGQKTIDHIYYSN
jgi:hypothetical protein